MSYDISLYRKGIKNEQRVYYNYDGNITYNVCEMLEVAFGEKHLKKWNDKPVNEFIEELKKGYEDMMLNPTKYKKYDSPNGWGTYETTLKAIQNLYNYIIEYTNYDGLEKETKSGGYHIRYQYYVIPFEFDGTLFTYIDNNTINQNEFSINNTIENIIRAKENSVEGWNIAFWIIWIIFIGFIDFGYIYLDNNYLED